MKNKRTKVFIVIASILFFYYIIAMIFFEGKNTKLDHLTCIPFYICLIISGVLKKKDKEKVD